MKRLGKFILSLAEMVLGSLALMTVLGLLLKLIGFNEPGEMLLYVPKLILEIAKKIAHSASA